MLQNEFLVAKVGFDTAEERTFQSLSYLPNRDRRPVPPPQTNEVRERVGVEAYVGPGLGGQIRKPGRGY